MLASGVNQDQARASGVCQDAASTSGVYPDAASASVGVSALWIDAQPPDDGAYLCVNRHPP